MKMIMIMKIISIAIDFNEQNSNGTLCFAGYLSYLISFNTSIFGPWVSFSEFDASLKRKINIVIIMKGT
jgi:hypothetical protein